MSNELLGIPKTIPKQYRKTFAYLSGEVIDIREKWYQYNSLFGFSQERIDLVVEGGEFFTKLLHDLLFDDAILGLARLFDPAESFARRKKSRVPNLSFKYLTFLLEHGGEPRLA